MSHIRKQSGYTLAEVITVTGVMSVVVACLFSMMIGSMREFDRSTTKSYTDADAIIAMQEIVKDVREAKSFTLLDPGPSSGSRLRVVKPIIVADGYYDRSVPDTLGQCDYYVSDSTGLIGHSGAWLWKKRVDGTSQTLLKRNVKSVSFELDTTWSVKITIVTEHDSARGPVDTELTQRVVYLRNY